MKRWTAISRYQPGEGGCHVGWPLPTTRFSGQDKGNENALCPQSVRGARRPLPSSIQTHDQHSWESGEQIRRSFSRLMCEQKECRVCIEVKPATCTVSSTNAFAWDAVQEHFFSSRAEFILIMWVSATSHVEEGNLSIPSRFLRLSIPPTSHYPRVLPSFPDLRDGSKRDSPLGVETSNRKSTAHISVAEKQASRTFYLFLMSAILCAHCVPSHSGNALAPVRLAAQARPTSDHESPIPMTREAPEVLFLGAPVLSVA